MAVNNNENKASQKHEKPVVAFWNKHRKDILIATGVIGAIGTTVLTILGVKYYWNSTAFERWFKKAPLDELKTVRDNIHSEYMKHTVNDEYRAVMQNRALFPFKMQIIQIYLSNSYIYKRQTG